MIAGAIVRISAGAPSAENRRGAGQMTSDRKPRGWVGDPKGSPRKRARLLLDRIKREKGVWWMPWRQEAMKDVALCD